MDELPFVDLDTLKKIIKIQSIFRGNVFRQHLSKLDKENQSALIIQNCWKGYITRKKLRKVQEVFALKIITKVVHRYKMRKNGREHFEYLKKFDNLLNFYPSASRDVNDSIVVSKSGKIQDVSTRPRQNKRSLQREEISRRSVVDVGNVVSESIWATPKNKKNKKKVQIIDLPPPWKGKDERRIGQNQKDDLLFQQKNNFAWAKAELAPLFWTRCSHFLDMSDDLKARNERYIQRVISCPFIFALSRCTKPVFAKSPHEIVAFPGIGIYMEITAKTLVMVEIESFGSDRVLFHGIFRTNAPLLAAVIQPCNRHVIGIDSHWMLHVFEEGIPVVSSQLVVPNQIPLSSNFLSIDSYGMLWVNLLTQGSDLYCCDTLTLNPTLVFKREALQARGISPKKLVKLSPIAVGNEPPYFVATFFLDKTVLVFNSDFSVSKKLYHKDMRSTPVAKQCGNFLIVYSVEKILYVYKLDPNVKLIKLLGTITVDSVPTDVCSIDLPPLILVSCEDSSLHVYLSQDISIPLRIPENKLGSLEEIKAANKIIGPMKYTQSRKMFTELRSGKFTAPPLCMTVITATDKCSIVLGALANGGVSSISIINDAQQIPACKFDSYNYYEPLKAAQTGCDEYNSVSSRVQTRRAKFLEKIQALNNFGGQAVTGQMRNIFSPGSPEFSLSDLILKTDTKYLSPFVPNGPAMTTSVYELFHLMKRAGVLSDNLSSLPKFIARFGALGKRKDQTMIATSTFKITINHMESYYGVTDLYFDKEGIDSIIKQVNPLNSLTNTLNRFTIGDTQYDPTSTTTSNQWMMKTKRVGLTKMINKLENLEDIVKHELMNRVQESLDKSFTSSLLDKMLPIPPIDLRVQQKEEEDFISFDNKPNRNPMIEESVHQTIVSQYSKYTLYGRCREKRMFYRALHVPRVVYQEKLANVLERSRNVSFASKKVAQVFHSVEMVNADTTRIICAYDNTAMPLSYYLNVHSFLGSDARLLLVGRSICCRLLAILYQFHQKNIIVRTIYPNNIMHNSGGDHVMFGSLIDSQFPEEKPLPLPLSFAYTANPFIPPEYYHRPLSQLTPAFDVWQFGILLLYIITGTLPVSYGSELMKHTPRDFVPLEGSTNDHPLFPQVQFFYDWLSNAKIVGLTERCIGERGVCLIQTDKDKKNPTILDIEHYTLLPYKSTKLNYDESKLFLEIIAECLQIDPEKRPSVETLLRTYPFNQPTQSPELLEMYLKTPDPDVFVSQFVYPLLNNIRDDTFDIVIGVIESIVFHDDDDEDDAQYAFPMENQANSRIVSSLFSLKFLDKLVFFVLDRISRRIQLHDVAPVVTFQDGMLDKLMHFFLRFVSSVENGRGPLVPYTNEMVMCIFTMYSGNSYFRFNSGQLLEDKEAIGYFQFRDSAPLFVFCHTKFHGLVRYILSTSSAIVNSIKKTEEHDEWFFNQFLNFGEANFNLSHSLCFGIEKQKGNAIKTLTSMWQNGQNVNVARMFIDFKIFQKAIHCLHLQGARVEALDFINNAINVSRLKLHDPTFRVIWMTIVSPLCVLHISNMMKVVAGNELIRSQAFDVIRAITLDYSINSIINLAFCDILYNLFDTIREPVIKSIIVDLVAKGNPMFIKVILQSSSLQKILSQNNIGIVPYIDLHQIDITLDISETLLLGKQLSNMLYIYQFPKYKDRLPALPPIKESMKFFPKAIQIILREAESIAKFYDTQTIRTARFDLKETTFLKAKNKLKEQNIALARATIDAICPVFKDIYKNIIYFYQSSKSTPELNNLLNFILDFAMSSYPNCRTKNHPLTKVIFAFEEMIVSTLQHSSRHSYPFRFFIENIDNIVRIIKRDYDYITSSAQKSQMELQVNDLYIYQRFIRFNIFKTVFNLKIKEPIDILLNFILNSMINNTLMIKNDVLPSLDRKLKFPIRDEALEIIKFLLVNFEKNQASAEELIKFISTDKLIDNERRLIQVEDNVLLIESSLELINLMLSFVPLQNEKFESNLKVLNSVLISKYRRKFNPKIFIIPEEPRIMMRPQTDLRSSFSKSSRRPAIINPHSSRQRGFSVLTRRSYVSRK